jgi:cytochrome P450
VTGLALRRPARMRHTGALPPGPSLPAALQTFYWVASPHVFMERCARAFGDCFTARFSQMGTVVFIARPELIKSIFSANRDVLRAGEANPLGPVLGDQSIILLDGEQHMRQRKLLLPPFHGERMQRYAEIIDELANREIDRWPIDKPFSLRPSMQALALEVILRTVYGVAEGEHLDELRAGLGDESAVLAPDGIAVARLDPASRVVAGAPAQLRIQTDNIHLFDRGSGRSLTAGSRVAAAA